MDKYRQAIIDLDREEPHDRPKDLLKQQQILINRLEYKLKEKGEKTI